MKSIKNGTRDAGINQSPLLTFDVTYVGDVWCLVPAAVVCQLAVRQEFIPIPIARDLRRNNMTNGKQSD